MYMHACIRLSQLMLPGAGPWAPFPIRGTYAWKRVNSILKTADIAKLPHHMAAQQIARIV